MSPGSTVVFETPAVALCAFSLRHFRDLRALADEPDVRRHLFWNQRLTDERLRSLIRYYHRQGRQTGVTMWAAYEKRTGAFVGVCGLAENPVAGGVEINVGVMPAFRGSPTVKEMYRGVLARGFETLGLDRIYGMVSAGNEASERFVAKIGFRHLRDVEVRGRVAYRLYEILPETGPPAAPAPAAAPDGVQPMPNGDSR